MDSMTLRTVIPGPARPSIAVRRDAAISRSSARLTPTVIASGTGATLTDTDDRAFVGLAGGIGTLALGHAPPEVTDEEIAERTTVLSAAFPVALDAAREARS